ncbi:MAG TPA: hypothetical protein VK186_25320 [Candidatus Deferrimicrobium sp.]|nr:hypothetical protein [Candidatus Kapabacteria bacterium]HLP62186.1 hypothetical protein [Candidatus Deferrimicrobium sp.]
MDGSSAEQKVSFVEKVSDFEKNVFINCPFDDEYLVSKLRPLLFVVLWLGLNPRIALERFDSGEIRIQKICNLINESKYSIHDLSRLQSRKKKEIFRLNMAFELGIDMGCRLFAENRKIFLVLEEEDYKIKKALSDFSGFDIKSHNNNPEDVIRAVRDWFFQNGLKPKPGGYIWGRYNEFLSFLYEKIKDGIYNDKDIEKMQAPEFIILAKEWIIRHQENKS